jgi:tRNA pseudouridine38-40 synthase
MPRFKLTIEYAGTKYSGWQIQKNARTVQGELAAAIERVTRRRDFELYGSGRTDAGVHAVAQVAHLDVATSLPADTLAWRVNDELPGDINLLSVSPSSRRFHARHDAVARRYVYQIARRRTAFAKQYVWWVKEALDVTRMRRAAATFTGFHDFASFAAGSDEEIEKSTRVLVERLDIHETPDLVLVGIEGSHFLWKMVRRLVGVLAEVGRGGMEPSDAASLVSSPSGLPARFTAPASGLFLERVYYEGDVRDAELEPIRFLG